MCDLTRFTLEEMVHCGAVLRRIGDGAKSMEEVASRASRFLYEHLLDGPQGSSRALALVRVFKTLAPQELPAPVRSTTRDILGAGKKADYKHLALLGTAGDRPEWNDRTRSRGHQAIPLASAEAVRRIPMISSLLRQLGVEVAQLTEQDPAIVLDRAQRSPGVFHVPEAVDSPLIPAQAEFVKPYGIRSAAGFGGMLPSGDLFATILFSKVPLSRETAECLSPLALNLKLALLPFDGGAVFAGHRRGARVREALP
jgi:hypothetical protein